VKIFITSIICVFISSCSSIGSNQREKIKPSNDLLTQRNNEIDRSKHPLCKYRENKGIAELLVCNEGQTKSQCQFRFYPGDELFLVEKEILNTLITKNNDKTRDSLAVGSEYRAVKKSLISGHGECPKLEINLKL